ncbi:MAG TPA: pectin acetylesterase-family hydrolase, partial [Myxococcota bacterium]|nr:pectin acetylesterase-family hydrolase [Myxococcota bacterium]
EEPALNRFWLITSRSRRDNPFQAFTYAYIPYCTGDLHLGDRVVTYPGADTPTHHVGAAKTRASLAALRALFPAPHDVWLYGYSAGGFAATYYADAVANAFPGAGLGVIDDSGLAFEGVEVSPQWNVARPPSCPACATDFSQLLLRDAVRAPERRYAYLSYTYDAALPKFFHQSAAELHRAILAFAGRARETPNVKSFIVPGYNHIVLQNARQRSGGEALAAWLQRAVVGDPSWRSRP